MDSYREELDAKVAKATALQKQLDRAICFKSLELQRPLSLIVMHPSTWQEINTLPYLFNHQPDLKYMGLKVLRSFDVPEGGFEIY